MASVVEILLYSYRYITNMVVNGKYIYDFTETSQQYGNKKPKYVHNYYGQFPNYTNIILLHISTYNEYTHTFPLRMHDINFYIHRETFETVSPSTFSQALIAFLNPLIHFLNCALIHIFFTLFPLSKFFF